MLSLSEKGVVNMNEESKLTGKEKFNKVVEAGLQGIPYVGGSLSTLYFGTKQEKEFKRLKTFYQELSDDIGRHEIRLLSVENHDAEKLISLIEELNEKIARESTEDKRSMFKKYLFSTLSTPTNDNYDERRYFLEVLSSISMLECEILMFLKKNGTILVGEISRPNTDQYAIVGSIGRLKSYGFLVARTNGLTIGGSLDNSLNEFVSISSFGDHFISYCID